MVATSGAKLISDEAIETLKTQLIPKATVITPNIPETEVLFGEKITSAEDMIAAAKWISETYHCAVLCKGGHNMNDAICCIETAAISGSRESASTTRTPTALAARFPARLHPISQRA